MNLCLTTGLDSIKIYIPGLLQEISVSNRIFDDRLTVVMMTVVTFVSCMVHVYTMGYMKDDLVITGFFLYLPFTFSMLILVMSNNFLQLFWLGGSRFGFIPINWVWFKKPSAIC